MKKAFLAAMLALAISVTAHAQSVLTPITQGLVWTPSQWTAAWQDKLDYPATTPVPLKNWTTSTRPSSPPLGGLGYNSTTGVVEWWNGSSWVSGGGSGNISGPSTTILGRPAAWGNATGTSLVDPGGWYNAVAYGADPNGASDSVAAFSAACTAAGANGVVYFPAGFYHFGTAFGGTCSVVGDGPGATVFQSTSGTAGMLTLSGYANYVQGIDFQGTVSQTAGTFLVLSGTNNQARQLTFTNFQNGIALTGNGTIFVENVTLGYAPGPALHPAGQGSLFSVNSPDGVVYIRNVIGVGYVCLGGTGGSCAGGAWTTISNTGFNIQAAGDINVNDSEMISAGTNMSISPGTGQAINSIQVQNTKLDNGIGIVNNSGIVMAPTGTGGVARGHFIGNWTSSQTNQAFLINPGASAFVSGIEIIDHESYGNTSNGLVVNSGTANGIQVIGGTFAGNNLNGIEIVAGSGFTITGAQFSNVGGFGANLGHDVVISSGVTNYSVLGNYVNGNGILDSAGTGIATCNISSSSNACGGGSGGSGTVNSCSTAGALAVYVSTGTAVSCFSTLTVSSSGQIHVVGDTTSNATLAIGMPANKALFGGGKSLIYGDGSGHQFVGETSGNGGTGVEVQNALIPSANNTYELGDPSFLWSATYTAGLRIAGITGSTQCLHVDSSGNVSGTGSDCGSSGGSGTVSSCSTSYGLALYATSGTTVSCLTSIAATSLGQLHVYGDATSSSVLAIGMPANKALMGAGHIIGYDDGSGHQFIGETTGNGGAGVKIQNALVPSVASSFELGDPSVPWSATYTNGLQILGITGLTQCLHVNSSGIVSGTGSDCGSGGGGAVSSVSGSGSGISVSPTTGAVVVSNTGVTSISAGTNISVSSTTGSVTVSVASSPSFGNMTLTGNIFDGSSRALYGSSSGNPVIGNTSNNVFFNTVAGGAVDPGVDNNTNLGGSGNRYGAVWATNGTIQTSDLREKDIIRAEPLGLDFIRCLKPFEGTWKDKPNEAAHHWLGAQDVEACLGKEPFWGLQKPKTDAERYQLVYTEFVAPLVKTAQELADEIDFLKQEVRDLQTEAYIRQRPLSLPISIPISH